MERNTGLQALDPPFRRGLFLFWWVNSFGRPMPEEFTIDLALVADVESALDCHLHPDLVALMAVSACLPVPSEFIGALGDIAPLTEMARQGRKPVGANRICFGRHPDGHAYYLLSRSGKLSHVLELDAYDGMEMRYPLVDWLSNHLEPLLDQRTPPETPTAFRVRFLCSHESG